MFSKFALVLATAVLLATTAFAQLPSTPISGQDEVSRAVLTSLPFLTIAPDARSAGMGDVGAATSPDANSTHWNAAKLAFIDKEIGASVSLTPWMQKIVGDMSLYYLSGYKKISPNEAVAASLRYFDLGSMDFTDINRQLIQTVNPREYAFDVTYSRKLSQKFSMAVAGRFIRSNLNGDYSSGAGTNNIRPANTVAVDISAFYLNDELTLGNYKSSLAFGGSITNMGPKITYTDDSQRDFIPANLRLGTALTTEFDEFNKLTFAFDVNKLLVPTPAVTDPNGNIIAGRDSENRSWVSGMFISMADAPDGFSEEMQELMFATGVEYWYNDLVALRGGYFHENQRKGNRQYFTAGLGLRYQVFGIDFAYLISRRQNHPLEDTLRFTLIFNFNQKTDDEKFNSLE